MPVHALSEGTRVSLVKAFGICQVLLTPSATVACDSANLLVQVHALALALALAHNLILVQDEVAAASGKDRVGGGMVTLHQMAEATLGQGGATASSAVYLGAQPTWVVLSARTTVSVKILYSLASQ